MTKEGQTTEPGPEKLPRGASNCSRRDWRETAVVMERMSHPLQTMEDITAPHTPKAPSARSPAGERGQLLAPR